MWAKNIFFQVFKKFFSKYFLFLVFMVALEIICLNEEGKKSLLFIKIFFFKKNSF